MQTLVTVSFTKHITRFTGIQNKPYDERLKLLNLYSVPRRRDRYQIIYLWKIIEELVPNLSTPITCTYSERIGRCGRHAAIEREECINHAHKHVGAALRNVWEMEKFEPYLRNIVHLPCQFGYNKSGRWGLLTSWSQRG